MAFSEIALTSEDNKEAHMLWELLMKSTNKSDFISACELLKVAPSEARLKILQAYAQMWHRDLNPQFEENPFELGDPS
ncbi:MAG: hypothetical protein EOP04_07700 [Proteobacteria bacterium]|nr:MAG: hypothetical protein EOP04_07700 [Pseudomonadota bacterium]